MIKTKYDDSFPLRALGLARQGLTDIQIAGELGISTSSFYAYQKRYPDFAEAVKEGKFPVDTEVENALLKKALGYKRKETVLEDLIDRNTGEPVDTIKRKIAIREISPDTIAAKFWLMNRRPDQWRTTGKEDGRKSCIVIKVRDEDSDL